MMQNRNRHIVCLLGCFVAFSMTVVGFGIKARGKTKETKVAIPAEQVITSIRTAIAAKPGNVLKVDAEKVSGKTICEVEILAQDGKSYDVEVDVATNTVIEVEVDDDKDE